MRLKKMNGIAKLKAKRKGRYWNMNCRWSQLLRIARVLFHQGCFLLHDDDDFLERVQSAVEKEEWQALALGADRDAAVDADKYHLN